MTNTAGVPGDRICSFVERVERHCQSKFYTDCLRIRAGQSSTVFAHESPTCSAGFDAENGLYLFALTVPFAPLPTPSTPEPFPPPAAGAGTR